MHSGYRIPVATVVGLLAHGQSVEAILEDYPQLTVEDVRAALEFAAAAVIMFSKCATALASFDEREGRHLVLGGHPC